MAHATPCLPLSGSLCHLRQCSAEDEVSIEMEGEARGDLRMEDPGSGVRKPGSEVSLAVQEPPWQFL